MSHIIQRAPYAEDADASRGRRVPENASRTRNAFARDRDRIIHSTAFRRLKEKTQVFVAHEGDHYRTRLTHSLEVAQIARSLAHALRLDTDLADAVATDGDADQREPARRAARRLAADGEVDLVQHGRVVDPSRAVGPVDPAAQRSMSGSR